MKRIYLDNAATSWPKPETVYTAVDHALRVSGAPAGRGGYRQVVEVHRLIEQTRGLVAELINAPSRRNIAFTFNGTDSLSTAILGLLRPGDHVVTSVVEHNSVLRPLKHLETTRGVTLSYAGCDSIGRIRPDEVVAAVGPRTRLISLNHVSNVTGTIQPVENINTRIRAAGADQVVLLIDAAQSLGHLPIDVQALGCDILASSGHKGLMGPLGTGILYVADRIAPDILPLRFGGTGTDGSVEFQPTQVPDKFESGNLNVPGIAGINQGIRFLNSEDGKSAQSRRKELSQILLDGIQSIDGISLQGPHSLENRVGVFSISIAGIDCHEASSILDTNWSIQTRAGLHCAPLIHRALGSESQHGTVRLSVGLFNTFEQVQITIDALSKLASKSLVG